MGEFRLKDIALPQRLFELRLQGLEREFAPPKGIDDEPPPRDPYGRIGRLLGSDVHGFSRKLRELGDDVVAEVAANYREVVQEAVEVASAA